MTPVKHDYQRLFHAIDKSASFDEKAFLNSAAGRSFVGKMPRKKNELYEKLLQVARGLRQSGGKTKRVEVQLREDIEDIVFLRERKLFEQGSRRLERAKKRAISHNLHEVLLEILRIERTIVLRIQAAGYEEEVNFIHSEIERISEVIKNKGRMLYFYDLYFVQVRQFKNLRGAIDRSLLTGWIESPELTDVSKCLSFEAESNFYFCHCIHHFLLQDTIEAWQFARTLYLRWQEAHEIQKVKAVEYRNVLQNYLVFCINASKYDDFDVALNKMLRGPFYSNDEEASAIDNGLNAEMQRCLSLCEWEKAKEIIQNFREKLDLISEWLIPSRIMVHYLNFSTLFIVLEDWGNALRWARKVGSESDGQESISLVIQGRLHELIAVYGQPRLGEFINLHRSTKRLLKKAGISKGFEIDFIDALLAGFKDGDAKKSRKRFGAILKNAQKAKATSNTTFISKWLEANFQGKSLRTLLEEER